MILDWGDRPNSARGAFGTLARGAFGLVLSIGIVCAARAAGPNAGLTAPASDAPAALIRAAFSHSQSDIEARGLTGAPLTAAPVRRTLRLKKRDTLMTVLLGAGVTRGEADRTIRALARHVNLRKLQVGQAVHLYLAPEAGATARASLIGLALELPRARSAVVYRDFDKRLVARKLPRDQGFDLLESIVVIAEDEAGKGFVTRDLVIRRGDTVIGLLIRAGAAPEFARAAAQALGRLVDLRRLQIGQTLTVTFEPSGAGAARLAGLALEVGMARSVVVGRQADGRFAEGPPAAAGARHADREPMAAPTGEKRRFRLRKGDILFDRLVAIGAAPRDVDRAVAALARLTNLRRLRVGQSVVAEFAPPGAGARLAALTLPGASGPPITVGRQVDGSFSAGPPATKDVSRATAPPTAAAEPRAPSPAPPRISSTDRMEVLEVARGDTLTGLLIRAGGNAKDARRAIRSLRKIYDPDRLRPGQRLVVRTGLEGTAQRLDEVVIETSKKRAMVVARRDGRGYSARRAKRGELAAAIESAHSLAKARPARPVAEPEPSLPRRLDHPDLADLSGARPKTVTVGRGGTLMGALVAAGADPDEANAAVRSARALFDPRKLRAGQQVSLAFLDPDTEDDGARPRLASLALAIGPDTQLKVARLGKGGFAAGLIARPLVRTLARVDGIIESSLYDAAIAAGLPVDVLMKLVRVFSYDVDFQRDIQKRDRFQLLYERFADESGNPVRSGSILYAEMTLSGTALALYRHRLDDGLTDHFDDLGQSVRKALMRTPIDGARLSSSFGMRRHPIQGYNKMHRGVDFAASRGTPIFAAGDGVVERASRYKSYGKYVRLRHSPDYGTAYGHLRAYAQGIYPGKRVKQGQVIGFVGSTGRSTGPHLHYEVLHHGRQVNPMSVKLPTGLKLTGTELARFEAERDRVRRQFAALPGRRAVAEHSSPAAAAGR